MTLVHLNFSTPIKGFKQTVRETSSSSAGYGAYQKSFKGTGTEYDGEQKMTKSIFHDLDFENPDRWQAKADLALGIMKAVRNRELVEPNKIFSPFCIY